MVLFSVRLFIVVGRHSLFLLSPAHDEEGGDRDKRKQDYDRACQEDLRRGDGLYLPELLVRQPGVCDNACSDVRPRHHRDQHGEKDADALELPRLGLRRVVADDAADRRGEEQARAEHDAADNPEHDH